jgi:hypothetical protein
VHAEARLRPCGVDALPSQAEAPRNLLTQTQALVEFSESLVANEVYAVKAAEDQTGVEGPYWLAKRSTRSYQSEEECVFAGDVIGAGFFVVKVRG